MIQREAWFLYIIISGVRLCWELEESKGPKGLDLAWRERTRESVQGAGCRVQGAGCRVQGSGCRVQGAGCRVQGAGCRVQGAGCRVSRTWRGAPLRVPARLMIQEGLPRAT